MVETVEKPVEDPTEEPTKDDLLDVPPVIEREPLKIADRCDFCGAQAYVAVAFESDAPVEHPGELLFCGHHYAKHEDHLREHVVKDQRDLLNERLVSSY